jgi:hypothetical protein
MDMYCVVCKKKTGTKDETDRKAKNGRTMKGGICTECGKKKCTFVKKE